MMSILLAQFDNELHLFQNAFNGSSGPSWFYNQVFWVWTLSTVGLLVGGYSWVMLLKRDRAGLGPTNRRVCTSLGVGFAERRLLQRVARSGGYATVTGLLMSEGGYDYAARHYARSHGAVDRLNAIRVKVYGKPLEHS